MDSRDFKHRDFDIDLETGTDAVFCEGEGSDNGAWSGFEGSIKVEDHVIGVSLEDGDDLMGGRLDGEERVGLLDDKSAERARKKGCRKPPKPPRPPRSPSMDDADRKLVREISELVIMKKARIERMKALKNMKNAKGSSSISSLCALVITVLFCFIIIWHGVFSKGSPSVSPQGSPESSQGNRGR